MTKIRLEKFTDTVSEEHTELHTNSSYTIGREEENSIVINDIQVSRKHLKISSNDKDFYIEDLDSTNGTWINEKKITKTVKLRHGDQINLGKSKTYFMFWRGPGTLDITTDLKLNTSSKSSQKRAIEISESKREVYINGEILSPDHITFNIFFKLYDNEGEVLTKEALDECWPEKERDSHGDGALTERIYEIRKLINKAFKDKNKGTEFIKTLPKVGYKFTNQNMPNK